MYAVVIEERVDTVLDYLKVKVMRELNSLVEDIRKALPDDYSESKDWKESNLVNRIEWLKVMYESKKEEIAQLEKEIEQRDIWIRKLKENNGGDV